MENRLRSEDKNLTVTATSAMSKILADREITKLLGTCIKGGDANRLNPNGIELRLGPRVRFISTSEEVSLKEGDFLKVAPGESVIIASLEHLDFSKAAVQKVFPGAMLMAWINPTTTMMREGISQVSTKVDAGFVGQLNWGLRNGSHKDLILQFGEPIFKLTLELLEKDEVPERPYGERSGDRYQNTDGIMGSSRRLPADIPKNRTFGSNRDNIDPKAQLKEAGYPFNYIGSELVQLQGKFELVSKDVLLLKTNLEEQAKLLSGKIEKETAAVVSKLDENKTGILEHVDHVFTEKFTKNLGIILGGFTMIVGIWAALQKSSLGPEGILLIAIIASIVIVGVTFVLTQRTK